MLRPQVEEHEIGAAIVPLQAPGFRVELEGGLFTVLFVRGEMEWPHVGGAGGVVFAQRVAVPGGRHEEAAQVRMAVEGDAKHVPDFTLVPVGGGPEGGACGQAGIGGGQGHLQAHVGVAFVGEQVVDDGEVAGGLAVAVLADALVDGGEVVEEGERPFHPHLQIAQRQLNLIRLNPQGGNAILGGLHGRYARAKVCLQVGDNVVHVF